MVKLGDEYKKHSGPKRRQVSIILSGCDMQDTIIFYHNINKIRFLEDKDEINRCNSLKSFVHVTVQVYEGARMKRSRMGSVIRR